MQIKITYIFIVSLVLLLNSCTVKPEKNQDDIKSKKTAYIDSLVSSMTLEEKITMVHGINKKDKNGLGYVGYLPGISRLGIPPLRMQNGPSGAGSTFSSHRHLAPATAFPVPIAQSATWNASLIYKVGKVIGIETKAQGRDVLLGPGVNIVRIPEGGRNFEYYSEDPYLSSRFAVSFVNGVQKVGIMACVKHFAANNQDDFRFTINEIIDERTLHEIYLPSFEAAIKEANVASIMAAYNKINGVYCSENSLLLNGIAKGEWGFEGYIMTDWGTRHKTVSAANAGLDIEMSGWGKFGTPQFRDNLANAIKEGEVKETVLDEMVFRVLSEMDRFGLLKEKKKFPEGVLDAKDHRKLAFQVAVEGIVLLKNKNNTLPLDENKLKNIALFGDAMEARVSGTGSSNVVPFYSVSPYNGISDYLKNTKVTYYTDTENIESVEDTGIAIVFIYRPSSEGNDRKSISLEGESGLIERISKKYNKTIVILRTSGSYTMPWIDKVDAVLQAWYPGQEEGNAEAALLFGKENPSAKLPVTFGENRKDFPANLETEFPGVDEKVNYSEGIYVGYRWFEKHNIVPLFAFGHGLSYTTFKYDDLILSDVSSNDDVIIKVSYTITNTGKRDGAEVSQLYLEDIKSSVDRPKKELKGFSKVFLKVGESKKIEHFINKRDLSFWDVTSKSWKAEEGEFNIIIGSTSKDIRLEKRFNYKKH
ncbi:MAG: glycoside hydrolase family 3 C-terminal domain-containing protein [Flavobacteriaceae bacterium]|nr:glycoside hydrolase family 3 C-terminal domain-containing protein [Flavobacteriaceae bacterium]